MIVGEGFWWFRFVFAFYFFFFLMLDSCVLRFGTVNFFFFLLFSFLLHLLNIPRNTLALFCLLSYKESSSKNDPSCRHTVAVWEYVHWMAANVLFAVLLFVVNVLT